MKKLLFLLLFAIPAEAMDACYSGSWYENPGEGINVEVLSPERTIGYWYSYGSDGGHRWYTFDLGADGSGRLYSTDTGRSIHDVGSASLDAVGDNLLFVYNIVIDLDDPPWCIGCEGDFVMRRLTGSCN